MEIDGASSLSEQQQESCHQGGSSGELLEEGKHSSQFNQVPKETVCNREGLKDLRETIKQEKDQNYLRDGPEACKKSVKPGKLRSKFKLSESGADGEIDSTSWGSVATRDENLKGMKACLIHVVQKMPRNVHAHFVLGLMYQRLNQPAKAAAAFQKAGEVLSKTDEELGQNRAQLRAAVQCHYSMSMLQACIADKIYTGKEFDANEIENWMNDLREAVQIDVGYSSIWNVLGLILLQAGQIQNAISVFKGLLDSVPDFLDALINLGVAYLQSGCVIDAIHCFQLLLEKDSSHPGALLSYSSLLLSQHASTFAGAGARAGNGVHQSRKAAATAAQQCLLATLKMQPKAGYAWVNLGAAYAALCDFCGAGKCLEQASRLEPNRLSTRYATALHRVHNAQFSGESSEQLSWAANEMASIVKERYSTAIVPNIAWAGLALVQKAQHDTMAAFSDERDSRDSTARTYRTFQQAIEEDPSDGLQWHQLGLFMLCSLQFTLAERYLKTSIYHGQNYATAWSNLGIALQLSDNYSLAEQVYQKALSLASQQEAHSIYSNLGNLYRQQKRFPDAHEVFKKALELCPSYAPACNNLGLLHIVEGKFEEAIAMFEQAYFSDPLLDAAKSNKMKVEALLQIRKNMQNGGKLVSDSSLDALTYSGSGNS